jgi:hypothetical protein
MIASGLSVTDLDAVHQCLGCQAHRSAVLVRTGRDDQRVTGSPEDAEVGVIAQWFQDQGFDIRVVEEERDLFWADLIRRATREVVAPRFGRGRSALEAARRAKERFAEEQ